VLALADRLRGDGVDAWIDRYEQAPPEGWPRWILAQVERADFVLCICTDTYRARFDHGAAPGDGDEHGRGVALEGLLAAQMLHDSGARNTRLVPVLLAGATQAAVPALLRPFTRHHLPRDYDALLRHLTGQHATPAPPLGPQARRLGRRRRTHDPHRQSRIPLAAPLGPPRRLPGRVPVVADAGLTSSAASIPGSRS
jgi:hypothetical protein